MSLGGFSDWQGLVDDDFDLPLGKCWPELTFKFGEDVGLHGVGSTAQRAADESDTATSREI